MAIASALPKRQVADAGLERAAFLQSMTVLGIGVDLVHLPRFAAFVSRRTPARVAKRILSAREHADFAHVCGHSPDPQSERIARFLAVRCARKQSYAWVHVNVLSQLGGEGGCIQGAFPPCSADMDEAYLYQHQCNERCQADTATGTTSTNGWGTSRICDA
jgi:hypothetical protein